MREWVLNIIRRYFGSPEFDAETRQYDMTGHWAASGQKTYNW